VRGKYPSFASYFFNVFSLLSHTLDCMKATLTNIELQLVCIYHLLATRCLCFVSDELIF
jgi:hypothetical protein